MRKICEFFYTKNNCIFLYPNFQEFYILYSLKVIEKANIIGRNELFFDSYISFRKYMFVSICGNE